MRYQYSSNHRHRRDEQVVDNESFRNESRLRISRIRAT